MHKTIKAALADRSLTESARRMSGVLRRSDGAAAVVAAVEEAGR